MTGKSIVLFIGSPTILFFCSFYNSAIDNSKVSFSAEILSIKQDSIQYQLGHIQNTDLTISVTLKNNSSDTIILLHDVCNPMMSYELNTPLFKYPYQLECYWIGAVRDTLIPYEIRKDTISFVAKKSIRKLRPLKFNVGYNFRPLDMFPKDSLTLNLVHELVPALRQFYKAQNIIWSDTLVIE